MKPKIQLEPSQEGISINEADFTKQRAIEYDMYALHMQESPR